MLIIADSMTVPRLLKVDMDPELDPAPDLLLLIDWPWGAQVRAHALKLGLFACTVALSVVSLAVSVSPIAAFFPVTKTTTTGKSKTKRLQHLASPQRSFGIAQSILPHPTASPFCTAQEYGQAPHSPHLGVPRLWPTRLLCNPAPGRRDRCGSCRPVWLRAVVQCNATAGL
jgi:hypothetical protein